MRSLQSRIRAGRRIRSMRIGTLAVLLVGVFATAGTAAAADTEVDKLWEAFTGGKPTLDMRLRIELAEQDNLKQSEAYTLRTRLGYGTAAYHGTSLYADFENVTAVATSQSYDAVERPTGQTAIADPTTTELNQAFMKYERKEFGNLQLIGGRQRIKLDDDRFIGNVGWRQNEQTYDAALGRTSLGIDDLTLTYGYLGYIRRIFSNQDDRVPADAGYGTSRDWESNSHLININYAGVDFVKPTVFIYLLDLTSASNPSAVAAARGQSSASYGLRLTGAPKISDQVSLAYAVSYAYQTDYADNPADYDAHYVWADLKLVLEKLGSIGVGYELLGSDDNTARFVTPLATAHGFNGWADVFLNNGGTAGLQDIMVNVSPKLPCKLGMSLVYHHFRTDHKNDVLGNEFDAVLKRSFGKYFSLLFKSAYFKSDDEAVVKSIWRVWLQAGITF